VRDVSGPRKITVGCVIFTVPRRNNVSHAVTLETPSARIETGIEIGSAIKAHFTMRVAEPSAPEHVS
jgi:hypothetical protein